MEKPELTKIELDKLVKQYWSLSEELEIYRTHMRGRKYKLSYSYGERQKHQHQVNFFKRALNETVYTLMAYNAADDYLLRDAIANRYLKRRTRWDCFKHLFKRIFKIKRDETFYNQ